jgi:membrane protein
MWLAASAIFSYYVGNYSLYLNTYSSLGAIAILMLWLYITAFLILLGAEIDEALRKEE